MAVRRAVGLNPRTVVIVNSGSGIQMTGWNDKAAAIVYAWYPGQSGNKALAEILCGDVNPSGKLPITIEKRFEDSPAYGYLPAGAKLLLLEPGPEGGAIAGEARVATVDGSESLAASLVSGRAVADLRVVTK
jgi:hypothetical protein